MTAPRIPIDTLLGLAIRHVNAGQPERAKVLCLQAAQTHPPHPAVLQLLAVLALQDGDAVQAGGLAAESIALRPDHVPTRVIASDAARATGRLDEALRHLQRADALQPGQVERIFQIALLKQDLHDPQGAAVALREVLRLAPERVEAEVNLGIVMQELGDMAEAMRAYGRAYRRRAETFGRISHALAAASTGRLWLDLEALKQALRDAPA